MTKIADSKRLLSMCIVCFILACHPKLAPTQGITEHTIAVSPESMEKTILYYVNEHRKKLQLNSLQMLTAASKQAYQHSRNMALRKTGFGHEGFDKRIQNIQISFGWISASAENVAYGQLSAKEVVKGWLNSPGHRKNIEGNYRYSGIGLYTDKNGILFFTQIFIKK